MDLREVLRLGRALLDAHGLTSWRFTLDNAKRRAGVCRFDTRTVSVSRHLMGLYDPDQVRDTVLHEIAHALVGPTHGHDDVWRAKAVAIGCSGSRLVDADAPRAPAPWRGTCPGGHSVDRHRRPARPASCTRCDPAFNPDHLLRWTYHGRQVPMGARYERALLDALAGARKRRATEVYADALARVGGGAPAGGPPGAPWWAQDEQGEDEGWVLDEAGRRWRLEEPPPEIDDPPWTAQTLLAQRAARGGLGPGWTVRLTAPGKYHGLEGPVVKRGRTRYHVRAGRGLLTVPFAYVEPLRPPGATG
jgi:hypothetical protein